MWPRREGQGNALVALDGTVLEASFSIDPLPLLLVTLADRDSGSCSSEGDLEGTCLHSRLCCTGARYYTPHSSGDGRLYVTVCTTVHDAAAVD